MGWGTKDIGDLSGRTVVVTGANSGLGEATTRALAAAGATVIMACRNTTKAEQVAVGLGDRVSVAALDLASLESIRAFAAEFTGADVLINNAGVMALPLRRTADGFEMQMGTNHLGHFALTALVLPAITDRVVTVSSGLHQQGRIDVDDLNWERRSYRRWQAYADSKMANLMFGLDLADRLDAVGDTRLSLIAHPGIAVTNLTGHTESVQDVVMRYGTPLVGQSAADGALPSLYAATATDLVNGTFFGPTRFFGMRGAPGVARFSGRANNATLRAALWRRSAELTGVDVDL
ncbi:MAG: oxidoreductase [Gordonia sp. (in: high G+C Gram-positive bacteria)]